MPVDPCFSALLADRRNELRPPPAHVALVEMRAANTAFLAAAPKATLAAVESLSCPGPGGAIPLRLYRPAIGPAIPLVVFMHGGGFVLGDLESHDSICRSLAIASGCVVAAVDYRLAPEFPFPAALDDCAAATFWLALNSAALGCAAERIALCGDSAGANLATGVALDARDRGLALRHLGLIYPAVDPEVRSASMLEFASGHLLTRAGMKWLWSQYLPVAADCADPRVALLRATTHGLPRTTIVTAEYDPLRDEGEALAAQMRTAGVPVTLRRYAGMLHGFIGLAHLTPVAQTALQSLGDDIRSSMA